jgi:hypothetical protein
MPGYLHRYHRIPAFHANIKFIGITANTNKNKKISNIP